MSLREELEQFYHSQGWRLAETNLPQVSLWLRVGEDGLRAVQVLDVGSGEGFTGRALAALREQVLRALGESAARSAQETGRSDQVSAEYGRADGAAGHSTPRLLSILLCDDPGALREAAEADSSCWMIDKNARRLVVYEDKIPDFCGMRRPLEQWLAGWLTEGRTLGHGNGGAGGAYRVMPVTAALVALNVLVFLIMWLSPAARAFLYDRGTLVTERVLRGGEVYRILTSMFLHAGVTHLFSNMIMLYFAGEVVERQMGSLPYLILYLVSGIAGNVTSMVVEQAMGQTWISLGASGAIFGVMGAFLLLAVLHRGPRARTEPLRIAMGIGLSLYNGFVSVGTNNAAHVGGLLGGLLVFALFAAVRNSRLRKRG
ncbi:MAG: rhomboid family intramembrane serine protease [Eubacteriales bacterium]|nr:rhomboid family intramembrane serine protease [Eubacteriales bacterium]